MIQAPATMDRSVLQQSVGQLATKAAGMSAPDVVRLACQTFGRKVVLSSSFGAEDMVLVDMLMHVDRSARIVTLDTGRLPQETYNVMDAAREKYGARIEVFFPQADAVQAMVAEHGLNLFYHSVDQRKRALAGLDAWITGLRREQSVTRTAVHTIDWDESQQLVKVNPLADWTHDEVWTYIREQNVPYNALHDRGYPSIGCGPCTRAVQPGEHERAGRWWWEHPETKECGLHVQSPESNVESR
jgi:phosphoadenosine phosphosulfate reductase